MLKRGKGRPLKEQSEFSKLLITSGFSLKQFCDLADNLNKGGKISYGVARSWTSGRRNAPYWAKNWITEKLSLLEDRYER